MNNKNQRLGSPLCLNVCLIGITFATAVGSVFPAIAEGGGRVRTAVQDVPVSVSVVNEETILAGDSSFADALDSQIPTYNVSGARPFTIRGVPNDFAVGDPYIIVNGVHAPGGLSDIDPSDIESVETLQGSSAVALYGSRGAGGVILITTKTEHRPLGGFGSSALPITQVQLSDFNLAIESRESCDATAGNSRPISLWFKHHDYGVGEFSSDQTRQYFGSMQRGFSAGMPATRFSLRGGGAKPQNVEQVPRSGTSSVDESSRVDPRVAALYATVLTNPQLLSDDTAVFLTSLMFLNATLSGQDASAMIEQGLVDARSVMAIVSEMATGLPVTPASSLSASVRATREPYDTFQGLVIRLIHDPELDYSTKMLLLAQLLFWAPQHNPVFADLNVALGVFDPDDVYQTLIEIAQTANAANRYEGLQGVIEDLQANPETATRGHIGLILPLIWSTAIDPRYFSDAAVAMGLFNPDAMYEWLADPSNLAYMAMTNQTYLATNTLGTIDLIDPYVETMQGWLQAFDTLRNDTSVSEEMRSVQVRALLYYFINLNSIAMTGAQSGLQAGFPSAEDVLADFVSASDLMTAPAGPFEEFDYPPLSAFDRNACTVEQWELMRQLIRYRDGSIGATSANWDYYRHPDTPQAEKTDTLTEIFDGEARTEALNLQLQNVWFLCNRLDAATVTMAQLLADADIAPEEIPPLDVPDPEIDVIVVEEDENGELTDIPAPGLSVHLSNIDFTQEFMLPFMPLAEYDYELHASMPSTRRITDATGTAWGANPPADHMSGGSRVGVPDDWQIRADYGNNRIGIKVGYSKIDSYVQTVPVDAFNELRQSIDTWSVGGIVPADLMPHLESGVRIGDVIGLEYGIHEGIGLNTTGLFDNPSFELHNNSCGDAAWLPQAHVASLLSSGLAPVTAALQLQAPAPDAAPVIVAVIDTGIDWNHQDLAWDNLWRNEDEIPDNGIDDDGNGYVDDLIGWDFTARSNTPWDNDGHGTFVAGLIAARAGNDIGIDGVNPQAKLMVLKALNNFGRTRATFLAEAIAYAADNGARVINISVTGSDFPPIVQSAIDYANAKGALIVMAAGNGGINLDKTPAGVLDNVLLVAATTAEGERASFSNLSSAISLAAPGTDVVSLRARATDFMYALAESSYEPGTAFVGDDSRYYRSAGTSFSAPLVAAAASLLLSERPELSNDEVVRLLEQSARDVDVPGRDVGTGYGLLDIEAARQADPAYFVEAEIAGLRYVEDGADSYIEVTGTADANLYAIAQVEVGAGPDPERFELAGRPVLDRVSDGVLTRIPYAPLAAGDTWTLRLVVEHATGARREHRRTFSTGR